MIACILQNPNTPPKPSIENPQSKQTGKPQKNRAREPRHGADAIAIYERAEEAQIQRMKEMAERIRLKREAENKANES